MGCQSEVYLGSYLTFSICTHNPATAALTDADDSPTYRIYEDETAAAILSGCLAKLDDGNTTGFYTEKVDCSASNGFDSSKSYTIYIEATVNSDTGGISYGFRSLASDATASGMWTYAARTLTASAITACTFAANAIDSAALATSAVTEIGAVTAGSGAITYTITVTEAGVPVDGAEVWITSDLAGTSVVAGTLSTNALGVVIFYLDAGTYYAWVQYSGTNFTNPTTIVVS